MRASRHIAASVLVLLLGAGAVTTTAGSAPKRQSAVVYLSEPTLIGSTIVQGPVLFVHDEERMARGEPCTTIRLFEPGNGPTESLVSFHCIPTRRPTARAFTLRTRPNTTDGFGCVLTEYQFAGDSEGHGVPLPANAH
jgi:hypothetical protein